MAGESFQELIATPFEGRVVSQADDPFRKYSDFTGNPTVAYPWSDEGVRQAVRLKEHFGARGFLRSGVSSSGDAPLAADGGLVVDLSHLDAIEVLRTTRGPHGAPTVTITAQAGVTIRHLANELILADAFLPIPDNPVKSVVSGVLSGAPGYFDRSMGRLRDYVESMTVITPDGELTELGGDDERFASALDGTLGGAITALRFSAVTAEREDLHVLRASFLYTRRNFRAALRLLQDQDVGEKMDVTVHAHHHRFGLGVVSVTIAGASADRDRMSAIADRLRLVDPRPKAARLPEETDLAHRAEASGPAQIVQMILDGGLSGNPYVDRNLTCRHHDRVVPFAEIESFCTSFVSDVTGALRRSRGGKTAQVVGSARLSLNADGDLAVGADIFLPSVLEEQDGLLEDAARVSLGAPVLSKARSAMVAMERAEPPPEVDLEATPLRAPAPSRPIPGFGGAIYAPTDPEYDDRRSQYASSSYLHKQRPGGSMRPWVVAYPREGTGDVPAALRFARDNGMRVVARSGGHQYSGMSSGGDDTILLSMDLYDDLEVTRQNGKAFARVGAGRLLTDIAAAFKHHGVTIPHGECPRVAIGGHVQTGGYGHLLRSHGLALDHVREFKIYLADGTLTTVQRPPARDDTGLFWGVLGGGPGSFGVVTEITFECIQDQMHPHSWGYARGFTYRRSTFQRAMEEIRRWTQDVAGGATGLPPDVDMCMTIASDKLLFGRSVFLLELMNGNRDGANDNGANRTYLRDVSRRIVGDRWTYPCIGFEGRKTLSYMSDAFVRRSGTTSDGREFEEPYKKRLNCTRVAVSAKFVDSFVDLVDRVIDSDDVMLSFQMFIGGGAYASPRPNPPLTSICHRDVTLGIVFDCFYDRRGKSEAEAFQMEMQALLSDYSPGEDVRMLWGSFGETDLSDDAVRKHYYDDGTWTKLQALKQGSDPQDVFHTEFTVQLP